jgi:hypothetical protein
MPKAYEEYIKSLEEDPALRVNVNVHLTKSITKILEGAKDFKS